MQVIKSLLQDLLCSGSVGFVYQFGKETYPRYVLDDYPLEPERLNLACFIVSLSETFCKLVHQVGHFDLVGLFADSILS